MKPEVDIVQPVMVAFGWLVTSKINKEDCLDTILLLMHC